MSGPSLADLLNDLDDMHSSVRDIGIEVVSLVESADRYEPEDDGSINPATNGEWIHRDDLLYELRKLIG